MFESISNKFMILLWFGIYGFAVYFIIVMINFMKKNNQLNKELLHKMDEYIQIKKEHN